MNQEKLVEVVDEFLLLQEMLIKSMVEQFGDQFDQLPFEWPEQGAVSLSGEDWRFSRHGDGFLFKSKKTGIRINIYTFSTTPPASLNQYQLGEYLESKGINVSAESLNAAFERLCGAGLLRKELRAITEGYIYFRSPAPRR